MQEPPKPRPHFPRILDSRRRAQEQTNAGAPKKRDASAGQPTEPVTRGHGDAPSAAQEDEDEQV
jgi:hypothetical protein